MNEEMENYEWRVRGLRKIDIDPFSGVITSVYWKVMGEEDGIIGTYLGETSFPMNGVSSETFIEYETLTEQIVIGWIKEDVNGVSGYFENIQKFIAEEILKQKSSLVEVSENQLPWVSEDTDTEELVESGDTEEEIEEEKPEEENNEE